jgi:hypothetical protein
LLRVGGSAGLAFHAVNDEVLYLFVVPQRPVQQSPGEDFGVRQNPPFVRKLGLKLGLGRLG